MGRSSRAANVQVSLDNPERSFNTMEKITGVTSFSNLKSEYPIKLEVGLIGSLSVKVTSATMNERFSYCKFLVMKMNDTILSDEQGVVPFTFTIPFQLLPCNAVIYAGVNTSEVQNALPPSLGEVPGVPEATKDSGSPEAVRIIYQVLATISEVKPNWKPFIFARDFKRVRVLPVYKSGASILMDPSQEPSSISERYEDAVATTMIRTRLQRRVGTIEMKSRKLGPLALYSDKLHYLHLDLVFTPNIKDLTKLPQRKEINLLLVSRTSWRENINYTMQHSESISRLGSLSSHEGESREKHAGKKSIFSLLDRTPSLSSFSSSSSGSSTPSKWQQLDVNESSQLPKYRQTICVPFILPTSKVNLVPSFENVLISRTYRLHVEVKFENGNFLFLKIPVELEMEPSPLYENSFQINSPVYEEEERDNNDEHRDNDSNDRNNMQETRQLFGRLQTDAQNRQRTLNSFFSINEGDDDAFSFNGPPQGSGDLPPRYEHSDYIKHSISTAIALIAPNRLAE